MSHVAFVHYDTHNSFIYTIIFYLMVAPRADMPLLPRFLWAVLLSNRQVFAFDIDVHCAAFADGTSQNKVCDFIFDRRCNQTF